MSFQKLVNEPQLEVSEAVLMRLDLCLRRLDQLNERVATLERAMGKLSRVVRA